MPVYSADLPQVVPASFLWALPALPALAALKLALAGRALARRLGPTAPAVVAVAATGASVGVALAGLVLAAAPGAHSLVEARGWLVDAGAVQVAATASLGWGGTFVALVALVVALAGAVGATLVAARSRDDGGARPSTLAAVCGLSAGGLAALVADDLVCVVVAWEVLVTSALALARQARVQRADDDVARRGAEALVASRVGQAAWLAGAALLFWGLGGDLGALAGAEHGRTTVTVDVGAAAGADMELRTLGDRANVASVRPVPVGPTLSFTEAAQQLRLRDPLDHRPFADALASRRFGPLPLRAAAAALLLLGLLGLVTALALALPVGRIDGLGRAREWAFFGVLVAFGVAAGRVAEVFDDRSVRLGAIGVVVLGLVLVLGEARLVRRALRELGVVPAGELAAGAAWFERRVLGPATSLLALAAVGAAIVLLGVMR
jgi:hypothetical protein